MRGRSRRRRVPSRTADRGNHLPRADDVARFDGNRSRVREIKDAVLRGTVDVDVPPAAQPGRRVPLRRKGDDDTRGNAQNIDRPAGAIVELVLVAIVDEDVVAGMALAVPAVE